MKAETGVTGKTFILTCFLSITRYSYSAIVNQSNIGLHGTLTYSDYLPAGTRFAGEGSAPTFDDDSTAVRKALDNLFPIIRKAGPRPSPPPHSSDLIPMSRFDVSSANNDADLATVFFDNLFKNSSSFKYVPLRSSPSPNAQKGSVSIDACQLARWNFELPLTRIPNAILQIISDENQKNKMGELLTLLLTGIGQHYQQQKTDYSHYNFFTLPTNEKDSFNQVNSPECDAALEFSFRMSVQALLYLYNLTAANPAYLDSLFNATRDCLTQNPSELSSGSFTPTKRLPCVNFAFDGNQLLSLAKSYSIFGSNELCSAYITPPLSACLAGTADKCGGDDLVALSIFARSFYLCSRIFPRQALDDLVASRNAGSNVVPTA